MDYKLLIKQTESIIQPGIPLVSNLANVAAILNQLEDINWCGFYLVKNGKLYLGPFQGEVACTVIEYGKGVCGTAYKEKRTIIVDDVDSFKGHIACSSLSKSEIVVPIIKNEEVLAVIDIDSPKYGRFTVLDENGLESIARLLAPLF